MDSCADYFLLEIFKQNNAKNTNRRKSILYPNHQQIHYKIKEKGRCSNEISANRKTADQVKRARGRWTTSMQLVAPTTTARCG
jgi:NAD(P)H-flavin reductase